MKKKRKRKNLLMYVLAIFFLILFLIPVVWGLMVSLRPREYIEAFPPVIFAPVSFEHYLGIIERYPLDFYLLNSLTSVGLATLLSVFLGTMAGYSLARFQVGGKNLLFWILSLRILPPAAVIVPLYIIFRQISLIDSITSLVLAYTLLTLPLTIWLMRSFFLTIPTEIEEAAKIDGCSFYKVLTKVSLPLAAGGMMVSMVFCFIFAWNDYIFALILATSRNHTITIGISRLITIDKIDWGQLLAGAYIAAAPIFAFTVAVQKYILRGLTFGFVR